MAREISPVCDFIFGSIRTNLLMDMVDVDLTIRMVKGIYTYQKGPYHGVYNLYSMEQKHNSLSLTMI